MERHTESGSTPSAEFHVDLRELARREASLEGEIDIAALPRLAHSLMGDLAGLRARWTLEGALHRAPDGGVQPLVRLSVSAALPLQCQRCLQAASVPVEDQIVFRLLEQEPELTEEELLAEDEALCVQGPSDVRELVEDQLILALPLVPMHPVCPQPLPVAPQELPAPESPFAALAALKRSS